MFFPPFQSYVVANTVTFLFEAAFKLHDKYIQTRLRLMRKYCRLSTCQNAFSLGEASPLTFCPWTLLGAKPLDPHYRRGANHISTFSSSESASSLVYAAMSLYRGRILSCLMCRWDRGGIYALTGRSGRYSMEVTFRAKM